jgi:hypothetical protein
MDSVLKLVYSKWFTVGDNKYPYANGTSNEFSDWAADQKITFVDSLGRIPQFESHYFFNNNDQPNFYFRNSNFYFHCQQSRIEFVNEDQIANDRYYFPVEIECNSLSYVLTESFINSIGCKILEYLRSGKISVLLVNMVDPSLESSVIKEAKEFFNKIGISKISLLQGNAVNDIIPDVKMYDSILSLYQTANEMDRYPYPTALGYVSDFVREEDLSNKVRSKKFISFNRFMTKPHRTGMAHLSLKYKLLDQGYFSFLYNNKDDYQDMLEKLDLPNNYVDQIKSMIPYQVDTEHLPTTELHTFFTVTNNKKDLYLDSYLHLVTETQFEQNASPFLSEKTWRPILNLQPFIYLGNHLALNTLIKLGFKTFSPYIDESYDLESDPKKRFSMIEQEIKKFAEMPIEKIHEWYYSIKDTLIYNQNLLYSYKNYNPIEKLLNEQTL